MWRFLVKVRYDDVFQYYNPFIDADGLGFVSTYVLYRHGDFPAVGLPLSPASTASSERALTDCRRCIFPSRRGSVNRCELQIPASIFTVQTFSHVEIFFILLAAPALLIWSSALAEQTVPTKWQLDTHEPPASNLKAYFRVAVKRRGFYSCWISPRLNLNTGNVSRALQL